MSSGVWSACRSALGVGAAMPIDQLVAIAVGGWLRSAATRVRGTSLSRWGWSTAKRAMACWRLSSLNAANEACALSDAMAAFRAAVPLSGAAVLSETDRLRTGLATLPIIQPRVFWTVRPLRTAFRDRSGRLWKRPSMTRNLAAAIVTLEVHHAVPAPLPLC
jgi:hypothetical protein